jgi:Protein of unknown function (DUF1579)
VIIAGVRLGGLQFLSNCNLIQRRPAMLNRRITAIALVATLAFCTFALSQDKDKPADKTPAMDPAMMKAMQDAAAPGPQHKALEAMAGDFTYVNKFKMDPSQDWMTSTGDYHADMALGGRYLMTHVKGPMMGGDFEGMGALAYDNSIQKYVSAWIDSMGTGIMRSEGTSKDDGKTITFTGEMMDPMMKKMTQYKYEFKVADNDHFSMTWWTPSATDGKMFESMTIEYTRTK